MSVGAVRRYPDGDLRRARGAGWRGWPGRVHIQYHHPEHGWTGGGSTPVSSPPGGCPVWRRREHAPRRARADRHHRPPGRVPPRKRAASRASPRHHAALHCGWHGGQISACSPGNGAATSPTSPTAGICGLWPRDGRPAGRAVMAQCGAGGCRVRRRGVNGVSGRRRLSRLVTAGVIPAIQIG